METVHATPPIVRGICLTPDKCFKLEPHHSKTAPEISKLRIYHHTQRMRYFAEQAKDPDLNLSLKEIQTGVKLSDRIALDLEVYLLGTLAIFWTLGK